MKWVVPIGLLVGLVAGCADERTVETCTSCAYNTVHPPGWKDPKSDAFHGKDLERRGWDFALCASCHGEDWKGKATAPSCLGCHKKGPTACDTCHANPPATGAHSEHVVEEGFACTECHVVPATWDAPGHILDENRKPITSPPNVTFGALANHDLTPAHRSGPASWDRSGRTCGSVWCHGGAFGDTGATNTSPKWDGGSAESACGTCHGTPPSDHAQSDCALCHRQSYSSGGALSEHHVNGTIAIGDGSSSCSGCHGDALSPAPPRGLHGEQSTSDLAVGAHRKHLGGSTIRGPIACNECHVVPVSVTDPGHLDSAGPAEVTFGTLATADSAAPVWDRTTGTCASVYCHGGGAHLTAEPSTGKVVAQSWTATTAQTTYCGACHGLPPVDSAHAPTLKLTDCATCHPQTVGPFGNILVANGKHINGVLDYQ